MMVRMTPMDRGVYLSTNKMQRTHRAGHRASSRTVTDDAALLWIAEGQNIVPSSITVDLYVWTVFSAHRSRGGLPDTDSQAWIAKRILDGAVKAGTVRDDRPQFVRRTHLVEPVSVQHLPDRVHCRHHAVLTTEENFSPYAD